MKKLIVAVSAGLLAASGIALAAPAGAGCQGAYIGIFGGGQRCDGPVDPLGNFTRCESGYGMGFGGQNCYVVNVGDPGHGPHIP
ncbi:hypothetical protein JNN96_33065 [Mycobacterium sp. DSM 3803]|nr:hypothetical protein [Mycobacterium sp. DSM 3803]